MGACAAAAGARQVPLACRFGRPSRQRRYRASNQKKSRRERLAVVGGGTRALPPPSLSFPDPFSTGGRSGTLRPSASPRAQLDTSRFEFFEDPLNVSFDGAKFNTQLARYFVV